MRVITYISLSVVAEAWRLTNRRSEGARHKCESRVLRGVIVLHGGGVNVLTCLGGRHGKYVHFSACSHVSRAPH